MNRSHFTGNDCSQVLEQLDTYLDRELPEQAATECAQHLKGCRSCSAELETRSALRNRLKVAVQGITVSPEVQAQIRQSLRAPAAPVRSNFWTRGAMAIAASLVVGIAVFVAYQLGHLRLTTASQEKYIASISLRVGSIMRVGLGDHVHCAVFRKPPKTPDTLAKMTHDMGPEYKDLIDVVKTSVAKDYQVTMAHQCRYHGRRFVHVTATNGSRLISLVISRKGTGESFAKGELAPVLQQSGIPVYQSGVQRFEIAGFETKDHLVYVVSDMGAQKNLELMIALTPGVSDVLRKLEA